MIVIDASSLAKYILREEGWKEVRGYLINEPRSLTLALAEVSNVIWKYYVLYEKISREDALLMLNALEKIKEDVIIFEPLENYLENGMKIAMDEKITIYDALYLAQAKKYGKLLTSDNKQWEIARRIGIRAEYIE